MYDLIIIGAGPSGLAASIYAEERKIKTLTLEAHKVGGQLISIYPYKEIFDFPSYSVIFAYILVDKMKKHAQIVGASIKENEEGGIDFVVETPARIVDRENWEHQFRPPEGEIIE